MLNLVPGGMGGSETYGRELTAQLATDPSIRATAYVPENAAGFSAGIPEVIVRGVRGGPSTMSRIQSIASAMLSRGRIIRSIEHAAVVHFPFTIPVPRPARAHSVVQTLLDVQHLDLPHLFSRAELAFRARFYEGAARTVDAVITISEFAKGRMVELLRLDPEKIHVAHLGVNADEFVPFLGEREEIVLYPARGWPHKNHARLVEAMAIVRRTRPGMRLVLTGGGLTELGPMPEWVDVRGLVSRDELRRLYTRAAVLAFPSLYEGFGLPPLEAMASGLPVAASDAGSIPEVVGGAAELFDPLDPESIADGILRALDRSAHLSAAGLEQVHRFTWEACRDVHTAVYREVA